MVDFLVQTQNRITAKKNEIKPLARRVWIPLELTATASAADAGIHQKIRGSTHRPSYKNNIIIIISNDEIKDITKIIKSLEHSDLLFKGVSKTIQKETQEKRGGYVCM